MTYRCMTKAIGLLTVLTTLGACSGPDAAADKGYLETDQGWSQKERELWYGATQGSRLIPLAWLKALEQPDSDEAFLDNGHLEKFRFLPEPSFSKTGLPLGFAIDKTDDRNFQRTKLRWFKNQGSEEHWVGLTCAACHTGEITYLGQRVRIDGGAALVDFQGFMVALNESIRQTLTDQDKFERFASKVLGDKVRSDSDTLKVALETYLDWRALFARMNDTAYSGSREISYYKQRSSYDEYMESADAERLKYGFGRMDAVGHIFNKISTTINDVDGNPIQNKAVPVRPDAPVSIPFLWNVPRHDRVQWNGIAHNLRQNIYKIGSWQVWPLKIGSFELGRTTDLGALVRNTVEVVGVFADLRVTADEILIESSVNAPNLVGLEGLLRSLRPPKWPAEFGMLDQDRIERGRDLFFGQGNGKKDGVIACGACHLSLARIDLTSNIDAEMSFFYEDEKDPNRQPPGTDPWMACNAHLYRTDTGSLEGKIANPLTGEKLGQNESMGGAVLPVVASRILLREGFDIAGSATKEFFGIRVLPEVVLAPGEESAASDPEVRRRSNRFKECQKAAEEIEKRDDNNLGYKARPLTGIWATAPYLHNGSVANLYDLLLPPEERQKVFNVGSREYDTEKVGYRSDDGASGNSFRFRVFMNDDPRKPIFGNSYYGHDYGNEKYSPDERKDLIEYLKTL